MADYTVTEAGFGADLGAEKFLDIKTPNLPTSPDAVVIVATLRALKMNGGVAKDALTEENVEAVRAGFANLKRHVEKYPQVRYSSSSSYQTNLFLIQKLKLQP